MTMINIQIVCDVCGKVGAESPWPRGASHFTTTTSGAVAAHTLRHRLVDEQGWKRGEKADSPKDYCHHCVVNGKTKRIAAVEAGEEKP